MPFVLWLALVLRAGAPGLVEFKYDEARAVLGGRAIAWGEAWPLTSGGTSWGIPRPALTLYLLALPSAVSADPRLAILFLGLLGTVAVAVVYRVGRILFDGPTAWIAAYLVAINPWAVQYDRKLWAHPLLLLSALAMLLAARLVVQRRPTAVLPLLVVLALQGQTHTLGWMVAIAALGSVIFWRPRLSFPHLAMGLAAAFLLTLPWLVGLGTARAEVAATVARHTLDRVQVDGWGVRFLLWLVSGEGLAALLGQHAPHFQAWNNGLAALTMLFTACALVTLGEAVGQTARRKTDGMGLWFVLAWMALPLLLFTVRASPIYLQYLTTLWPASFLLIARPPAWLWPHRRFRPLAVAFLLLIGVIQVGSTLSLRGHLQQGEGASAFGVPLARWQRLAEVVAAEAQAAGEATIYVLADGSDPAVSGQPAVLVALLEPLHLRFVGEGNTAALLLPEGRPSLYLLTADAPLANPLLEQWGEIVLSQPLGEGVPVARLYRLRPVHRQEMGGAPLDVAFDNGLRLWRADLLPALARAGDTFRLTTTWLVESVLPDAARRDWTTFAHLLDADGQRRGQFDGFGHPSRFWQAGDMVIQWHPLAVYADAPTGDYTVLLGVYARADGARALTGDGRDAVTVGPLRVTR